MTTSAGEISIEINGNKAKLDNVLRSLERELKRAAEAAGAAADGIGAGLGASQDRAAKATLAHARAEATLKAATGDTRGAIQSLTQALAGVDKNSTAALRAQTQLARLQTDLTRSSGGLANALKGGNGDLLAFAGGLGLATTAVGALINVADRVKEGFQLRATLDEQRRSVGVFLQDVQRGDAVFASAISFGKKYGFTQAEMGQAAREASPLIAQSTTSVEKQLEVLGRLASLNTAQGISGATFSTKELASGDITSIVERFNLSRAAARGLKEEIAGGADVFQVLDRYLNSVGVTTDILSQRMQGASGASRSYAQAQEGLNLALGQLAEGPGVAALDILSQLTNAVTGAFAAAPDAQAKAAALNETLLVGAKGYADYAAQAQAAEAQIATLAPGAQLLIPQIGNLTRAQYEYAQALIESGTAAATAMAAAEQQAGDAQTLVTLGQQLTQIDSERAAGLEQLGGKILQVSSASEQDRENTFGLVEAYTSGTLSAENLEKALNTLIAGHVAAANAAALSEQREGERTTGVQAGTGATEAASVALQANAAAMEESAAKSLIDSAASEELAQKKQQLEQQARAAASALLASGGAGAEAAGKLASSSNQVDVLTAAYYRLAVAQAAAGQAKANAAALSDQRAGERDGGSGRSANQITIAKNQARDAAAAQKRYAEATETSAQKTARLRNELAGLRTGSASYYDTLTKLTQAETQAAKGGKKGRAGGGAGGVDPAIKAAQTGERQITENQFKEQNKREDGLIKYEQQRLKISQDYAKKRLDAERAFDQQLADTNATFYDTLINLDNQGLANTYSAQYEQVLSNLPQIAAEKGADVADAYLQAQESALKAQAGRAQEIAKAEEEGNAGRAEALRGVDKLYRESEQRKVDAALNRQDTIATAEAQAQQDAANDYEQNEAKITVASDRSTEKISRNIDARIAALDKESAAAGKTAAAYDRIGGRAPSATSSAPGATTGSTPTTPADDTNLQGLAQVANRLDTVVERLESVETAVRETGRDVANAAGGRSSGGTS